MLRKEILEARWKAGIGLLVFWTLAGTLPGLLWYIQNNAQMKAQLQLMPTDLTARLNDFPSLVFGSWFGQNVLQMGTVFAVILGSSAIAGEVSKRTMEFLLSKPVSRLRVLLIKEAVGVVVLGIVLLTATAVIYPLGLVFGYAIGWVPLLVSGLLSWVGLSAMFALAVFFSTIFDDVIKTAVASLVTALVLTLPGLFGPTSRFSIYSYMQDYTSFQTGTIPFTNMALLLAIFAVLVSASYISFRAKEF